MNETEKIWLEEIKQMSDAEFMKKCEGEAYDVLTAWAKYIKCGKVGGKKQFYLSASHSWGTAYCDWSHDKWKLFRALESVGAVSISGRVGWNYVDIYFNKRKRL